MKLSNLIPLCLGVITISSIASAEPASDAIPRATVTAIAGVATPVGNFGIEYTHAFGSHFELGGGIGIAGGLPGVDHVDPQLAVMPRMRWAFGNLVLTAGAGVSGGTYDPEYVFASANDPDATARALWANAEVGVAYIPAGGGFTYGLFGGYGKVVAHGTVHDGAGNELDSLPHDSLPYIGIRIGHTL